MAGEIATENWIWSRFPNNNATVGWHNNGPNWCPHKSDILKFFKVRINGNYGDNQLVEQHDIQSLAEVRAVLNMSNTLTGNDNYKLNLGFNNNFTIRGLVFDNSYTLRNTGGSATLKINGINIIISEEYRYENIPNNDFERPTYTYESYDVDYIGVYVNEVYKGRIGNGYPAITVNTSMGDTIYFSNGARGVWSSRVKLTGNIYIND